MTVLLQEAAFRVLRKSPDMPLNVSWEGKLYDVGLLPMVPTHPSIVLVFPKFAVSGWLNSITISD